ncbi:hypothetical protein [Nocardia paucivorans]|uniref:hypothetical protein n=1 Tax=Nocardia paucivorans TaxID=114259 RepID=UPI00068704DD|nr:hypothetical protein [Nocardia paucivorans]
MPADVAIARQLWWGVIGLGVVRLFVSLVDMLGRREEFVAEMTEQLRTTEAQLTPAGIDLLVTTAIILSGIFGLGFAAIGLLIVHQLGKGRLWARTVLTFVGVWLVFTGLGTLFAIEAIDGIAPLVAGAAALVQAVLAGGAIYLCHREDAAKWFQVHR